MALTCDERLIDGFLQVAAKKLAGTEEASYSGTVRCTIAGAKPTRLFQGDFYCAEGTELRLTLVAERSARETVPTLRQMRMEFRPPATQQKKGCGFDYSIVTVPESDAPPKITPVSTERATQWCSSATESEVVEACRDNPRAAYLQHADGDAEAWDGWPIHWIRFSKLHLERDTDAWETMRLDWKFQTNLMAIPYGLDVQSLFLAEASRHPLYQQETAKCPPAENLLGVGRFMMMLILGKIDTSATVAPDGPAALRR
ncbi:MAG: hypothetical protein HYV02_02815 [Deltaproteobacteria bacterium]|nr:hypothetical protein [Deltaproteobacteria bacterium]